MKNTHALSISLSVFLVLLAAFFALWFTVGINNEFARDLLFFAAMLILALVSVSVYQGFKISESAEKLATGMAENMLTSSQELFSQLYKMSPVPYVLITQEGVVQSTNVSALRLFKIRGGELDDKNVFDLIESEGETDATLFIEEFRQGLFVNDKDVQIVRSDGTKRWVLLSLFPYTTADGKREGLLTLVDITKQKEIDKAKSEFVSLASHQLLTPIAAMGWNLELFRRKHEGGFTEEEGKYIEKLEGNLKRMNLLINDFLNVSKLELGTLVPEPKPIELTPFFAELLEEQAAKIVTKRIRIEEQYDEQVATITTDEHLYRMAIGNLISNAVKYTPEDGTVSIETRSDGQTFTVAVKDTGIGIPEDDQAQIFSKLFRASNAKEKVTEGTGLGLYVVREALEVLGGGIIFESQENIGTTFTATIPLR